MHQPPGEDIVNFIHIPKTGGSTLRWILDRQYRDFLYLVPQWFNPAHQPPSAALATHARLPGVVGAHRPFDSSWPPGRALAMVRDPVRRVLSHVTHLRAEPQAWLAAPTAEMDMSIADWIDSKPLALFDNNQVRYLSGAAEYDSMPITRRMDESDLEMALRAVRERVLVAPMELFDEALLDWSYRLAWDVPYYRRVNVRQKSRSSAVTLSSRDKEALASWNRLDEVLCEEVRDVFLARLEELENVRGVPIAEQLASFRLANQRLSAGSRILWHTVKRGFKHPVRAGRMVARTIRQRSGG